jgi:hypothetical protein
MRKVVLSQERATFFGDVFMETKYSTGVIPGVPRTVDELKASVARAEEEYKNGLAIEHDEVLKKHKQWL